MLLIILTWTVYIVGLLPIIIILRLFYAYKLKPRDAAPRPLQKPDWVKDTVYLCQFPLVPNVRTISPFALKLETWLRMTGIPYENLFTLKYGSKGQIPYIELNGQEIPDSNVIICKLKNEFNKNPDKDCCSPTELAVGHTATVMIEQHTANIGFHYRYGRHMQLFLDVLDIAQNWRSPRSMLFLGKIKRSLVTRLKSYLSGIGRHQDQEVWEMSFKDLKALSYLLGTKPYFLGSFPTTVDCVIFGHLAQFMFIDIGFPQKTYMEEECQNLVSLVERMKAQYWPRWEQEIEEAIRAHIGPERRSK